MQSGVSDVWQDYTHEDEESKLQMNQSESGHTLTKHDKIEFGSFVKDMVNLS